MPNMAYCRWQDTSRDLQDGVDATYDEPDIKRYAECLSKDEKRGFDRVIKLARQLVEDHDNMGMDDDQ